MKKVKIDKNGIAQANAINELTADSGVKVEGILCKDNTLTALRVPIINVTSGAVVSLDPLQSGSLIVTSIATGFSIILPNPEVGLFYDFVVKTTISSGAGRVASVATTHVWSGSIVSYDFDTLDKETQWSPDGTDYGIEMNGTTTGAKAGTAFRLTCLAANNWNITGATVGDGSMTTPFI